MHKNMNATELLNIVSADALTYEATPLMAWEIGAVDSADDVARYLWHGGPTPPEAAAKRPRRFKLTEGDNRPNKKYWYFVKQEMFKFLCENDPKYAALWERLGKLEKKSTGAIVVVVSGYIGEKAGVEGSILAGFVAVCLYGFVKISKEAFCAYLGNNNA